MTMLPGYALTELLKRDETTAVFRGRRESDGVAVIVKVLDVEYPTALQLARIRYEYDLLKPLDVPGVIKVQSLLAWGHSLAIVMDDFAGLPLRAAIGASHYGLQDKLRIARGIAQVMGDLHAAGLIHKDINPDTLLLSADASTVKIIDFGIASQLSHEIAQIENSQTLEGRLAYISPEQTGRMNRPIDYRSDFYSLGVTLYELLVGEPPFTASSNLELMHMHMASVAVSVHSRDATIPQAVSKLVDKLLQKNAEDRYRSASGIVRDLDACLAGAGPDFEPGRLDASSRFTLPSRLYGREQELGELFGAFDAVCGGQPHFMLVSGYSGIGKTSLIHEIRRPLAARSGFFIAGKFDQYRRNIPYSALIAAFRNLLQQVLVESEEQLAQWRHNLLEALGGSGQVLMAVLPELLHVIGPQPELPVLAPQEAQNRFNLCFVNFIRVFTRGPRPLVLSLDDLQWADIPSINLMELLSQDSECRYLLLLFSYRSNEVDRTHPWALAMQRMRASGVAIDDVELQPLPLSAVAQIVADTVNRPLAEAQPLADVLVRRTQGNPFFVGQLLKALHTENLIVYDGTIDGWTWKIEDVVAVRVSDNVADLMAAKIRGFAQPLQRLLRTAACIGNEFALRDLAAIVDDSNDAVAEALFEAVTAELLNPIGNQYRFYGGSERHGPGEFDVSYRFSHDRIQQAAYDLLDDEERAQTHFKAGVVLLRSTLAEQLDERLFDIVSHYGQALAQVRDTALRLEIAELHLRAAIKAKNAIAYEPALSYIRTGGMFLDDQAEDGLRFRLLVEQAECEHLNGNADQAEALYRQALGKAGDDMTRANVYEKIIHFYTNTNRFREAYDTGRQAVRLFGVSLPANFVPPLFLADLAQVRWKMRGRSIESLIDLPLCRDEKQVVVMRLLAALEKAAYQIRPELCVACATKAVNLTLSHGITEDCAISFLVLGGVFLGGVMGNRRSGYEYGRLALAMNARFNYMPQSSEVHFVAAYFTTVWIESAVNAEQQYRLAYENGLQTGDFFHLSCAMCTLTQSRFMRGVALAEVAQDGESSLAMMRRIHSHEAAGVITAVLQTIKNLQGRTRTPASFEDGAFNEAEFVATIERFTSQHFAHFYFINKMQALYLWGLHDEALRAAEVSASYLKHSVAMLHTAEHHFFAGLTQCAIYRHAAKAVHLRQARRSLAKLERWARLNPVNFEHKASLLRAEVQHCLGGGRASTAAHTATHYIAAIRSAAQHGYVQTQALANELAGRFFLAQGVDMAAQGHLREALYGYRRWGADGLAGRLEREFPAWLADRRADSRPGDVRAVTQSSIDLETVVKASHALSSEIKLPLLLHKLMAFMIENTGAQSGALIGVDRGSLLLEVTGAVGQAGTVVAGREAPDPARLPLSVIHYVARVGQSVVLSDARLDQRFWGDGYIKAAEPRSVLCAPIVHRGQTTGIIYLENKLATGVFTEARLKMLEMLSAQAAISLENARMYENLEDQVAERTAELHQSLQTIVESRAQVASLLDNSGQGFLSFGANLVVNPECSRACEAMLGEVPVGRNAAELLFPADPGKRELLASGVAMAVAEEDSFQRELLLSLLPGEVELGERLLKMQWRELGSDQMMLVLTDISEERRLAQRVEREHLRLKMVVAAVIDSGDFFDATDSFRDFIRVELPQWLRQASAQPESVWQILCRELHTYKGVLSQFSFEHTPSLLHELESRLQDLSRHDEAFGSEALAEAVQPPWLEEALAKDMATVEEVLGKDFLAAGERVTLEVEQAEQLRQLATRLLNGEPVDTSAAQVRKLLVDMGCLRKLPIKDVMTGFDRAVAQVSARLEKEVAPIIVEGDDIWIDPTVFRPFARSLVHVFRNAVTHGIEHPDSRLMTGKSECGHIKCVVRRDGMRMHLSIGDDGSGIDTDALRQKAVDNRLYSPSEAAAMDDAEVLNLIFIDNFSLKQEVDQFSGRGAGLAAVRAEVLKLNGRVAVESELGQGTRFVFSLPIDESQVSYHAID